MPHLAHFIFVLFLLFFGMFTHGVTWILAIAWLGVWVLHILFNTFSMTPFLCSQCGQKEGEATAESIARPLKEQQMSVNIYIPLVKMFWIAGRAFRAILDIPAQFWAVSVRFWVAYNRFLQSAVGEENVIIYRFIQGLSSAILAVVLVFLVIMAIQSMFSHISN
ncbi:MAG TPA: hypothetical protein VIH42_08125 [Thermoguttaceae bacterium]